MRGLRADELLLLPVRLHGIQLGRAVDLILDLPAARVVGLDVLCGDDAHRFVAFAAVHINADEIAVGSALTLLEESQLEYYRDRGSPLRALRGHAVSRARTPAGLLKDVVVRPDGAIEALLVERDGAVMPLRPEDALTIAA
jgi:hypothetical protein